MTCQKRANDSATAKELLKAGEGGGKLQLGTSWDPHSSCLDPSVSGWRICQNKTFNSGPHLDQVYFLKATRLFAQASCLITEGGTQHIKREASSISSSKTALPNRHSLEARDNKFFYLLSCWLVVMGSAAQHTCRVLD